MKAVALLLCSLVLVVAVFMAGVAFTAYLVAEPEPHRFANLDAPDLWTAEPVAVDQQKQQYERIAPAPAIASLPPAPKNVAAIPDSSSPADESGAIDEMQTGAIGPEANTQTAGLDPAHAEWCFDRYRSYRMEDNTYQPYSGPRRTCESPWTPIPGDGEAADAGDVEREVAGTDAYAQPASFAPEASPVGAHEEWCFARYRSYRVEDNSYQPFGGPRRTCVSPHG